MFEGLWHRTIVAGAALAFAAGCSGTALAPRASQGALLGPLVAGPRVESLVPRQPNAPRGWPDKKKKKKEILFVADGSSGVLTYNPKMANGAPTGSITTGVVTPAGVAVDKHGTLYVANEGNATVTVYPKGHDSPSLTISSGLSSPYGIAVDSKGDVFVSSLGTNHITAYAAGSTMAYETIDFSAYGQAVGVAVDGKDNVWVACDNANSVFIIPAGTTSVQNAHLSTLAGPIGISFGPRDKIYVSNFTVPKVNVYVYGTTTPSAIIADGLTAPTLNGITSVGSLFQANQDDNVVGYKKKKGSPFSTLDAASALGVASWPLVQK
jgi:streptogramin lyase